MNIAEFIAKWQKVELKERSAAQEHFLDLCEVLGHPKPAEADPTGETYGFERGAARHGGGDGFADVWKKGFFGWEYKGRHKDLDAAYDQLLLYRDALENPPLLVVCDMDRLVVHTNFTRTASATHELALDTLGEPRSLEILRAVFFEPEKLRPGKTSAAITQEAARQFAGIAETMRARGLDSGRVAHFLDRIVFCLFAEDIGLLPDRIFTRITEKAGGDPEKFGRFLGQLFEAMARGGEFGLESIRHFNGSLFDDASGLPLSAEEIRRITEAARLDWSAVDPSIFGTLFERGLDPAKRSQLGAHFTGKEDIETLVDAVILQPLRREWEEARTVIRSLLTTGKKTAAGAAGPGPASPRPAAAKPPNPAARKKARGEAERILHRFLARLQSVKVLDPACGSGNFLYVALQKLKDLEKEVILHSMGNGLGSFLPMVGPWQLYGLELNPYAHDLAQMTVWIGWLQWIKFNGFGSPQEPILRPMTGNFQCRDAILNADGTEPDWPRVDFIVGNPPFLGGKMLRRELGDGYMDRLFALWNDRVPREADLCCYWFEKARAHIEAGGGKRAGLLATQGIRGGANREVLKRIKETGDIFWAVSDKDWFLDGANVHVSLIAFDNGSETDRYLDGLGIQTINANLTPATGDLTTARPITENRGVGFMGTTKQGPFDVSEELALKWLQEPNPNGRPNSDVVVPWLNGMDVTRRSRGMWIVDFFNMTESEASQYAAPFKYLSEHVKAMRDANPRAWYRKEWWQLYAQRPEMRRAIEPLHRFLVTPTVSKHRLFVWQTVPNNPDHQLIVFARSDDYFFGVLHSRAHEVWALKLGTRLETRPRYTPTTCFETFPFPAVGASLADARARASQAKPLQEAIADAARELNELRERWLNPPEWTREEILEFPGTPGGPWARYLAPGTSAVRYPRLVPRDEACAKHLKKRTLTALYNERPAWLDQAHRKLDAAVFAAYGWPADLPDEAILERLLALNREQAVATD
ncbi:MAG: class I SAM-dependent DNA methyltransferase [Kiritimatiellae bacterium]|nr:class I SAM-dependent DNA methyltransferase [Kiritimatiellia bacterium]